MHDHAKKKKGTHVCVKHVFLSCLHVCAHVPQLYTQLTVILDDPDFPRLTLSVSQLSRSNLCLSVTHTYTDPAFEVTPRTEVTENNPTCVRHAHAQTTSIAHLPICHMPSPVNYLEALKARRKLTAAKLGKTKWA